MAPFHFKAATRPSTGIIISCPHAGTDFPEEIRPRMEPDLAADPIDTDWHVEKLYAFAPEMGIPIIWGRYSRYVIDLNRDLDSKPLYADKRLETGLIPATTFAGRPIAANQSVTDQEKQRRIDLYYRPYHEGLRQLADEILAKVGHVLILEGHSIRRHVPTIRKDPFPDLMLGNDSDRTCPPEVLAAARQGLAGTESSFSISANDPFRGGFITRSHARPRDGIHTLQLEMSQDLYMDEQSFQLNPAKAAKIQKALTAMTERIISALRLYHEKR